MQTAELNPILIYSIFDNMIKGKFEEILEEFNGRIKNPLILSFILVWLYFHWSLIYRFFSLEADIPSSCRLAILQIYIKDYGWCGMILCPLLFSFVSLAAFYLIAILGQIIKTYIGKNLANDVLKRINPSDFIQRTEKEFIERDLEKLKIELTKQKEENKRLIITETQHNEQINKEKSIYAELSKELNEAKTNIDYNIYFKEKMMDSILYLMASNDGEGHENRLFFPDRKQFFQPFLNGSWKILIYNSVGGSNTNTYGLIIKEGIVFSRNGQNIGIVDDFTMDIKYNIISMYIRLEESDRDKDLREDGDFYYLLKINDNELIGMRNSVEIVKFEREL